MKDLLERLRAAQATREKVLGPGRCACYEPSVKWCTRHGRPLKVPTVLGQARPDPAEQRERETARRIVFRWFQHDSF